MSPTPPPHLSSLGICPDRTREVSRPIIHLLRSVGCLNTMLSGSSTATGFKKASELEASPSVGMPFPALVADQWVTKQSSH